jgi:glycerol-3-phosphate dehydrogenase (NAD(P)+)
MSENVLVLGNGGWGTALSLVLHNNGNSVTLWGAEPDYVDEMRSTRKNPRYLSGISIPEDMTLLSGTEFELTDFDSVLSVIPTQFIRSVAEAWSGNVPPELPILSCSKGIELFNDTATTEILRDVWETDRVAVLSGPSHAEEVAHMAPTAIVAGATDEALARHFQDVLMGGNFRVYSSDDPVGVELGGALKNCIALAAGICDGLELGDNAKSALLSRGLIEMGRFIEAAGGRKSTVFGLSGLGDLMTTSFSPHGRNLSVGRRIGAGETLQQILDSMAKVAEGVWSVRGVLALAAESGVDMPITREVAAVLYEDKSPREAVMDLMGRGAKSETLDLA